MIIGIDASRANRQYKSGTEWYSYHLIRELAKIDSKNQYLLYTDKPLIGGLTNLTSDQEVENSGIEANLEKNNSQEIISQYNNFRCKIIKQHLPFFWTQLSLSLEMLFHPPDVLFIPAHTLPIIHPQKSVVTIHDIGFIHNQQLYSHKRIESVSPTYTRLLNLLIKIITLGKYESNVFDYHIWSTKFTLKHAKKIITVSKFSKKEIEKFCPANLKKIQVIYNGYNNKLYQPFVNSEKNNQVLDKYGIKQPYIFYVGRLEKKKNITTLVEAYVIMREKYKNIKHKLVLVGSASYGFNEINYIIQEFNINSEVILTGWVPEEDMPVIYHGATAFVFPSCYEGFGIPLLQAMACNTPIIASDIPAISEIVEDSALLFDPLNKKDIAEAMAKIITDDNLRKDLIARGQRRINYFSNGKNAQETLALLENM
ncbi:MAG: glycosyltransferase family 1 protein [bacterium]|nr:glycosyltransferase family 1 protein [bacterium]